MHVFEKLQLPVTAFTKKALVLKDKKNKLTSSQHSLGIKTQRVTKVLETGGYVPGGH